MAVFEHSPGSTSEHNRHIIRAQSGHDSSTIRTVFERSQHSIRAQSAPYSSTIVTVFDHNEHNYIRAQPAQY